MQKNLKIIIIIAVIIGATGITIGTIALTQPEPFNPIFLLFPKPTTSIDNKPTSNQPGDIITNDSETIDWILYDDVGPGQYRVWANDTNDNYYVWVDWIAWSNNTNLAIPINRSALGVYNYTIEFNDSNNHFGTPHTVIVTVINKNPTSNHPGDIFTAGDGVQNIGWILYDDVGSGQYRVWANDTNDNYYVWVNWTSWTNDTNLNVPINRSAIGTYNYTIEFNDSNNHFGNPDTVIVDISLWTWISGNNTLYQAGNYGIKGVADANNFPGARLTAFRWVDSNDTLWLFGGRGHDSGGTYGYLNDLWKFDSVNWTWISGNDTVNQNGTYGTKGFADANNIPGGRDSGACWIDSNDTLWLFGGDGYDANSGITGRLNDLWKFDGVNWTWVSGSNVQEQQGTYGTKGIADVNNIPGARRGTPSWIDSNDTLWLFGGDARDDIGNPGYINDLWKFNGINWTWVSGNNLRWQLGTYGTKGVADSSNVPGARAGSGCWIDSSDNLWLFGGGGYTNTSQGSLNDLWKHDGVNWTWVSGNYSINNRGTYGTKGVPDTNNVPGARGSSVTCIDSNDTLWYFGGFAIDATGSQDRINDLWKFDGVNWTWVSGSNIIDQSGNYGTKGVAHPNNIPGARSNCITWIDSNDILWLFGGLGYISGVQGRLNDLWKFE